MAATSIPIEAFPGIGIDADELRCVIKAKSATSDVALNMPLELLPRLVALGLQALGSAERIRGGESSALMPDGMEVMVLPDARVGVRFLLPGGAPLTFVLERADAESLGNGLLESARTTGFS